jgi:RNA 2',3'-cyclic 3'-phosphodiesterase
MEGYLEMRKVFVSVTVPDHLQNWMHSLLPEHRIFAKPAPGQYHLTLRYIGKTGSETLSGIRNSLKSVYSKPFKLEIRGTGFFPNELHPRVLWLGVEENENLNRLVSEIDNKLLEVTSRIRGHPFHPHITLARLKLRNGPTERAFDMAKQIDASGEIAVKSFQLMESLPADGGVEHRLIEHYPLTEL